VSKTLAPRVSASRCCSFVRTSATPGPLSMAVDNDAKPLTQRAQPIRQGMGSSSSAHRQPIGTFPPNLQEMLLMDDLLYVMLGIEGKYIRAKPVGKSKVRSAISLRRLDSQIPT
jgi:hypothetical protein